MPLFDKQAKNSFTFFLHSFSKKKKCECEQIKIFITGDGDAHISSIHKSCQKQHENYRPYSSFEEICTLSNNHSESLQRSIGQYLSSVSASTEHVKVKKKYNSKFVLILQHAQKL